MPWPTGDAWLSVPNNFVPAKDDVLHYIEFSLRKDGKDVGLKKPTYVYVLAPPPRVVYQGPPAVVQETGGASVDEAHEEVGLPFRIVNDDGQSVTLYYKFDDSASWNVLPRNVNFNVVPFSLFAPLSYEGDHSMQIYASNDFGSSEPITFGIQDIFEKVRNTVKGYVGSGTSPNAIIELGLKKVGTILPNAVKVSYSFDDNNIWSEEVSYPMTMKSIAIPGNSASYVTTGDHKITYEFVDNLNNVARADYYYVVSEEKSEGKPNAGDDAVADDDSATSDDIDTNGYVFGSLSTAGFVAVVVGGVGVIILAVGVLMIAKRKMESSSTGLIEEDE
jgi:hypothetical protein